MTRAAKSVSKFWRKPHTQRSAGDDEEAEQHQPCLAEHVGQRAEQRLHQRIGQGEAVVSSAAVAGSTLSPTAICGMTGSVERMNSALANTTNAMRLSVRVHRS